MSSCKKLDNTAVSIFVVILVELINTNTNTVFVNSTNITTNTETAALSSRVGQLYNVHPAGGLGDGGGEDLVQHRHDRPGLVRLVRRLQRHHRLLQRNNLGLKIVF